MASSKDPDFKVMLAHKYTKTRIKDWSSVFVDTKRDGVRVIATVDIKNNVIWRSRNGRVLDMFHSIDDQLCMIADRYRSHDHDRAELAFDGEMVGTTFGEVSGTIHRKDYADKNCKFLIFHVMPLASLQNGLDDEPQMKRFKNLSFLLEKWRQGNVLTRIAFMRPRRVQSHEEVMAYHKAQRAAGHEGTMVKLFDMPWIGKRSYAWLKIKDEDTFDLKIIGFKPGKGKYEGTLGAVIVDYKGVSVPVSGMDDKLRDLIWRKRKSMLGKIAEIKCHEVTVHGSLRHPRWVRLREDKS